MIKYGVSLDEDLLDLLEIRGKTDFNNDELIDIVSRCVRLKAAIVEQDETERSGRRAVLNFGHTIGHAVEAGGRMRKYRHGEAVAIGMSAAAKISERLGMLDSKSVGRIEKLLHGYGLSVTCSGISPETLFEAIRFDKKTTDGRTAWVLLNGIGNAAIDCTVPEPIVKKVLSEICK